MSAIPVHDNGESLVRLDPMIGRRSFVRSSLADRLAVAQAALPLGIRLHVVEGHRTAASQQAIVASYSAELCAAHPGISADDLHRLSSRFVAPLEVAPHVAGAAVDLTLIDACGQELDLGTPIDATPEQSGGRCYFAAERHQPRRPRQPQPAGPGPDRRRARELPDRVVALELRRPLLGPVHWCRPRRLRPRRSPGGGVSALPMTTTMATARPAAVGPELIVDLEAVAANSRLFAARAAGELMAVVKADGFGHGSLAVARTALANGATWLGVTSIEEALPLRAAGLQAPILSWLNPVDADFGAAIGSGVDLAVPSREHLLR